ncbi:ParB/RepB/Spo0J family partition protein [bacterium]|nr:ParB/RepB/Spo0J family partition protein [bacterium]
MNNIQMESQILQVPIEDIIPNRFQPRLSFDDASLADLASSIKQHGIIQPLVLRRKNDKYEIIAGERRFKAAKMAGLVSVPAVISNLDDNESAEVAIVENIQRKDLTAIEEARSYQALLDKGYMTQDELARKMGLSQSAISNKLRLLTLDEAVQEAILAEKISERHARTLLKVPSHEKQRELLNKVINERLTVKQLEDEIKNIDTTSGSIVEQPKNNEINKTESLETITQKEAPVENINTPSSQNIDTLPNIEDIFTDVSELKDITKEDTLDDVKPSPSITPDAFFSNPEKMPNKFFNFLEDTAANMDIEEITPTFEIPKVESKPQPENLINQTDNIEMLDDFFIPTTDNKVESSNNDYLNEVIKTIRNLHLDSDKVVVEEMNLPTEYHINIKIKKDLNN